MTLRRTSQYTMILLASTLALLPVGCGSDDPPKKTTVAKGGASAIGGSSSVGGSSVSPASGGSTDTSASTTAPASGGGTSTASGGTSAATSDGGAPPSGGTSADTTAPTNKGGETSVAGATAVASGGNGATAGGGNTTPTAGTAGTPSTQNGTACTSDITCKPLNMLCNTTLKRCVECLEANDCTASPSGKVCDVGKGKCVACTSANDCADPANMVCVNNACQTIVSCTDSRDCPDKLVCSEQAPTRCVECNAGADCDAAGKTGQACWKNACTKTCRANSECTGGLKCNTSMSPSVCAECATHADCGTGRFCSKGTCGDKLCVAGEQTCIENGVAACDETGTAWGASTACPADQACILAGTLATCGTPTCPANPPTVDPCSTIPRFFGTQTVDAKNDEFCNVPTFQMSFAKGGNAGVFHNKVEGGSVAAFTHVATAQVAWDSKAFHAFVKVEGPAPTIYPDDPSKIWDGDSIELMITTNGTNPPPAHSVDDANSVHVQANYAVAALIKSDGTSGNPTKLDATQFLGKKTDNGYVIEINIPWPGAPTLKSGSTVRFDMAMNVDVATVDPQYKGRDAQAVYTLTSVAGSSGCSETPATPFCDERLWCPTTLK